MDIFNDFDLWGMLEPFAVDITGNPGTTNEFIFRGIFDNAHAMYAEGDVFSSTNPKVTCLSSDASKLTKSSAVAINGVKRTIRDIQPDGWGITVLELKL